MTRTHHLTRTYHPTHHLMTATLAAALLAGGITAASAQTFTVDGSVSGPSTVFTYSYLVTPTAGSLGLVSFNFSDTDVTPGAAPAGFVAGAAVPASGIFQFLSTSAGGDAAPATFTFTSPDGAGGSLGATNISTAAGSSGVAMVNDVTPAPAVAPEPSQVTTFGVVALGVAGLMLRARRRRPAA